MHAEQQLPPTVELPVVDESLGDPEGTVDLKTQIIRFTVTGGLSAIVDFGLYLILLELVGLPVAVAKAIGFIAGTTTAYLINRRWTFQAAPSRARFLAVVALYATTFAVQVGINQLMVHLLGREFLAVTAAFVVAQGTATVINFLVQRVVIFRMR
ncbi:GtrA family protein [Nocardia shimofusensis]|uniref:GtrA family protein n=1 Tax=Nocardia shimofusensis TaxID=228596 RepID=UPI000A048320|nr:GtrA family protein [Nocardia shimofusensis]